MQPEYPKISIVTPSYNQGQYLEQTILSVIGQNYPNLEYIIIDGGSTDNSVEIIKRYADKISYWISEKDKGQSDALNKGLQKCTGEIFNWINSDDYFEPGSLFKVAEHFSLNQDTDILCGWCGYFESETGTQTFIHRSELFESTEHTLLQQRINQPASFYKLSVIETLGGINTDLHYVMDLELWFRYLARFGQKNIFLTEDMYAHFRLHDASKTVQVQPKFREEEKQVWHQLLSSLKVNRNMLSFFSTEKKDDPGYVWHCDAIGREKITALICDKYFFDFYKVKNYPASRFAFLEQLKKGKLSFNKMYLGMFRNLFLKRS